MREDRETGDEAGAARFERDRAEAFDGDDRPTLAEVELDERQWLEGLRYEDKFEDDEDA